MHRACDADVVRLVVARLVAREEDRRELVERELPVRRRIAPWASRANQRLLRIRLGTQLPEVETAFRHGHRTRERAADEEAAPEHLAHVANFLEVAIDEALLDRLVV